MKNLIIFSYESQVLELKVRDNVKDAIHMLYEKDIFGAPIADDLGPNTSDIRSSNRYIGFIDFASMVLWCLEVLFALLFI